jgi:hypothetical protein
MVSIVMGFVVTAFVVMALPRLDRGRAMTMAGNNAGFPWG